MPIPHRSARRIASRWHAGGGSALYALTCCGAIDTAYHAHDTAAEVEECIASEADPQERFRLSQLKEYVTHHRPRGPVPGWSRMPW